MSELRAKTARVRLRWPASQAVLGGGGFFIYMSARNIAAIDYETPINAEPVEAWPVEIRDFKIGDGLGRDGSGADGFGEGGFPDGEGPDGLGPDGFGTAWLEFFTNPLEDGTYIFAVCPVDQFGNINTTGAIEKTIEIAGVPYPPSTLEATEYDVPTGEVTIEWQRNTQNVYEE